MTAYAEPGAGAAAIPRHLTAMHRSQLSMPVSSAMSDGVLTSRESFFDYGCGRGGDVKHLAAMGYDADGWDPAHKPDGRLRRASVVNLGYVVNVIENPQERAAALRSAWDLAESTLVVSARPIWEARGLTGREHGDGVLTARGTFQKFFEHDELRGWIDSNLGVRCVAAAPCVFYAFKDAEREQAFLASRVRRRPQVVRQPRTSELLYAANREAMEVLLAFITSRGRIPEPWELRETADQLIDAFSSIKRAAAVLRRVLGNDVWEADLEAARRRASQDLLVYLALGAFSGRPKASNLPPDVLLDIRSLFGSYRAACQNADDILLKMGDQTTLNKECASSTFGKLTPEALYVHVEFLEQLSPLLRIYEGCARVLTGTVTTATLVKMSRMQPKVSYLVYPTFARDAHPVLHFSIRADLPRLNVRYKDFRESNNPPILHRKETFLPADHPNRVKFEKLTRQEERAGLLEEAATIGTRLGWQQRLSERGYTVAGHRLLRERRTPPLDEGDEFTGPLAASEPIIWSR